MDTYSFISEAVTSIREAKEVILRYESKIKSPCYVELLTEKGEKRYYVERSNLSLKGNGWIVVEKMSSQEGFPSNILPLDETGNNM
ncbi:hypothetical protein [Paenibacillus lautus]|uniref:Uncharacterized protein n=1 Tax=Paenibacillus lautus TaxID=1401 RepID=A0A385TDS4_PAELA|nr:hypothetical protein [Paenibacillus lautus]AYB41809.1 hypothetical protein D5F53_00190 [Paenibacillus lautus]